ncbi:zinc ribbon domain-containing protein [Patescibacteria group bacterium]|nr:zinc ribbon domain-containing protein [Patescibacteria group bacterium]
MCDCQGGECKCQACGMLMKKEGDFGTEEDGGKNCDYCIHCYQNGMLIQDEPKAGW